MHEFFAFRPMLDTDPTAKNVKISCFSAMARRLIGIKEHEMHSIKARYMIQESYSIDFTLRMENSDLTLSLSGDVEQHHSEMYYLIKNFRIAGCPSPVLPDIELVKMDGNWVHRESRKETNLSETIGQVIDARS
jgi:hypothetical protein